MSTISGKIFFRTTTTSTTRHKGSGLIIAGVLEAQRHYFETETMFPTIISPTSTGPLLVIDPDAPHIPQPNGVTPLEQYDLSGLTIQDIWRVSQPGFIAGDIFLRKTLVPTSTNNNESFAFVGCMLVSDETLLEKLPLEQLLRFSSTKEVCVCMPTGQTIPKGNTISGLLNEPFWGNTSEPVALQSDLPLPIIEGIHRYYHHRYLIGDSEDLLEELAKDYRIDRIIHHLTDNQEFNLVMKRYFEINTPPHLSKALTANELAHKSDMMNRAMHETRNEREQQTLSSYLQERNTKPALNSVSSD